jgi:hypothetical protein
VSGDLAIAMRHSVRVFGSEQAFLQILSFLFEKNCQLSQHPFFSLPKHSIFIEVFFKPPHTVVSSIHRARRFPLWHGLAESSIQ